MMEQYVEPCIYCHKDIVFSEGSSVVVCSACGRKMASSSFQSRQLQMRKALEEGEAAKENLKAAEQAKQEANERLFSVISALSDIQSSQENTEEKINTILNAFQGEEQLKKVIIHLLQGIRSEQGDSRDVLTRLMAAVASGRESTEKKLEAMDEVARTILNGQQDIFEQTKSNSRILELLKDLNLSVLDQRMLAEDYIQWSKDIRREDIERLQNIQRASDELLDYLRAIDQKVDEIRQRVAGLQESIDSFHDQWQADKLDELNKLYQMASGYQAERNYSKAAEYYQKILVKGGESPEIYWRLILCHYCVDYQEDDDGTLIPIILNPDLTDPKQLMVRKSFDERLTRDEKRIYSEELRKLDSILEKYRLVHQDVQYDVFISVKQNDHGHYTEDSDKASELYDHLTSRGLRVFNSRRTKIPAGQEYEPYIISALMSAKVLIVVSSREEYISSRWIQNEWLRFQWLQQNETKLRATTERILFCYLFGDMKPEKIPRALNPNRQAIVEGIHSKDELDNVMESVFPGLRAKKEPIGSPEPSRQTLSQTLDQMTVWLLEQNYPAVLEKYHELKKHGVYLNNAKIHLLALCARLKLDTINQLEKQDAGILATPEFRAAEFLCQEDEDLNLLERIRDQILTGSEQPEPLPSESDLSEPEQPVPPEPTEPIDTDPVIPDPVPPKPVKQRNLLRRILLVLLILFMITSVWVGIDMFRQYFSSSDDNNDQDTDTNRLYHMSYAPGYFDDIIVFVTTNSKGIIQDLHVFADDEPSRLGKKVAGESFVSQFIGKKAPFKFGKNGIDAVSGATFSSNAALQAINQALGAEISVSERSEADVSPYSYAMVWKDNAVIYDSPGEGIVGIAYPKIPTILPVINRTLQNQEVWYYVQQNQVQGYISSGVCGWLSGILPDNTIKDMIVCVRIYNTIDSLNKIMKCARYDNYSFTYATNVFFDSGKDVLTQNGKDLLDQFIPLYLSILMKDEFSPFLNNLCVEVHSGTIGSSDSNLKLTQQRAEAIVSYCQTMDSLSEDQLEFLKEYLTGVGYGSEKPVLNEDSTVDEEASPRIVFSLDLKSL